MDDLVTADDPVSEDATYPRRDALNQGLTRLRRLRRRSVGLGLVALLVLACLPLVTSSRYHLVFATLALVWAGVALGWNIVSGNTGYISFGHAAFFGIGAYASGIAAARWQVSLPIAVFFAGAAAGLLALLVGALTLRLKGHYFAIATLAMAEATRVVITLMTDFTGGSFGLGLPVAYQATPMATKYYVVLGSVAAAVVVSLAVEWSPFGGRLLAIREDEIAVAALGIDPRPQKIVAFIISGTVTGIFGAFAAWVLGFLTPEAFLDPVISLEIIIMVIIGGSGTVLGPVVGAVFFYWLSETVLVSVPRMHLIVLGTVLILGMLFLRDGLVGALQKSRVWPKGFRL